MTGALLPTLTTTATETGTVFVLRFCTPDDPSAAPDNVFSPDFLDALDACLAEVESSRGPAALVTTGAGKFYSNGLDLGYLGGGADLSTFITRVHGLFARMLRLETPTVAAVNGHAFGAGAMLVLCHDHRIMRSDRGYWNLPEAALGMPFPPGMNALVTTRLGDPVANVAMLTSKRYSAHEALADRIVHDVVDENAIVDSALARAAALAPMRGTNYAGIRTGMLAEVLEKLGTPVEKG